MSKSTGTMATSSPVMPLPNFTLILIYIEWCDAIDNRDGWVHLSDALEWGQKEDWLIKQTGFLLKETKEYLLLAGKINPHDNEVNPVVSNLIKIPKTWIRKRKTISYA